MFYRRPRVRFMYNKLIIIAFLLLLLLPAATAQASPPLSTPRLSDGAAQTVTLHTGPGYQFPIRYEVDVSELMLTARYGEWVQVGMLGWMVVNEVDPTVPDVSAIQIPTSVNGVIVGVMSRMEP